MEPPSRTHPDAVSLEVYPNPLPGTATIRLGAALQSGTVEIYDLLGRLVDRVPAGTGARELRWDARALAPGVYVVSATAGTARARRVVVRVK
jgi:hypothetical protein